jgi:hypothetical protein
LFERASTCLANPLLRHFDWCAVCRIVSTGDSEFSVTAPPRIERIQKYLLEIYLWRKIDPGAASNAQCRLSEVATRYPESLEATTGR